MQVQNDTNFFNINSGEFSGLLCTTKLEVSLKWAVLLYVQNDDTKLWNLYDLYKQRMC